MKNYKIAVAGTGYVGLSLGVLFAQHHQVVAVDIVQASRCVYKECLYSILDAVQQSEIYPYLRDRDVDADEAEKELRNKIDELLEQNAKTAPLYLEASQNWENFKDWLVEDIFQRTYQDVITDRRDAVALYQDSNPWLMKFRAISIPETLERTHLKEWLDHVWIVDFEQVEVILQESEWKRFFPEEWLNNGEEDCNGKKE